MRYNFGFVFIQQTDYIIHEKTANYCNFKRKLNFNFNKRDCLN